MKPDTDAGTGQRLDKWLWFARVAKTRSLAGRLVAAGKVRVNKVRAAKPSRVVRQGDVLTLTLRGRVRVLRIVDCGARRGPAAEARGLYEDLSPPAAPRPRAVDKPSKQAWREKGAGRPTKRERRRMEEWVSRNLRERE